jgi:hypothetical protein
VGEASVVDPDGRSPGTKTEAPKEQVLAGLPTPRDSVEVAIGDLAVAYRPEPPESAEPVIPAPRRRWRAWPLAAGAAALVVAGVAIAVPRIGDDSSDRLRTLTPPAATPQGIDITVSLSQSTIHYGESVTVSYSWRDDDGELLDVNNVGSGALHVQRNTKCRAGGAKDAQPIADQGTWVYTADGLNFGPPPETARQVQVGLKVHTGGCAPEEDKTVTETLTVLPPA